MTFLHNLIAYNLNALSFIVYTLKTHILLVLVLIAMGYIIYQEIKINTETLVDDERPIL